MPFSVPSISEPEIAAVAEVLRSGWITTGAQCAAFETAWCEEFGSDGAVAVASATAGMHLLFCALGLGPGDEVITPSLTWVSTINLIALCGATPVFVDVDPDTLCLDPAAVEAAITPNTRAIIPVHYAGAPADLDALGAIALRHGITLIEDAAHAAGTYYRGRPIGARGTAVFSFHPIKNMTTGEGGMVVSDDAELLQQVRRLRFHGLGADSFDRQTQGRSPQAQVQEPGYKYNLTDIAATLGLGQLQRLPSFNERRTALAGLYTQLLQEIPEIRPLAHPAYPHRHAHHLFIVRVEIAARGLSRDAFMEALKTRNIGSGLHFRAVHEQRYYRETAPQWLGRLPATEANSATICSLPLFPAMTEGDVADVVAAITDILACPS